MQPVGGRRFLLRFPDISEYFKRFRSLRKASSDSFQQQWCFGKQETVSSSSSSSSRLLLYVSTIPAGRGWVWTSVEIGETKKTKTNAIWEGNFRLGKYELASSHPQKKGDGFRGRKLDRGWRWVFRQIAQRRFVLFDEFCSIDWEDSLEMGFHMN